MKYPSPHKLQMYHWYLPKPLLSISLLIKMHFFSYSVWPSNSDSSATPGRACSLLVSYFGGVGERVSLALSAGDFLNGEKPIVAGRGGVMCSSDVFGG